MLELIAGLALGSLGTLGVTWWLNRNAASRGARRETYLELLTMLKTALRVQQTAIFDHDQPLPDVVNDDNVDAFNARLELDATTEVRELTDRCFKLAQRFNACHLTRTPVDVDEHGLYVYRSEKVRGQDPETVHLLMRMSLGRIHDDLAKAVELLAARVRKEVHGSL
jgi:hypothetical protein